MDVANEKYMKLEGTNESFWKTSTSTGTLLYQKISISLKRLWTIVIKNELSD